MALELPAVTRTPSSVTSARFGGAVCGGRHGRPGSLSAAGGRGACVDAWGRPGTASDGIRGVRGLLGAEGGVRAAGGAQGLRPRSLHGDPPPFFSR